MDVIILGAGMMGRAIAYDLCNYSNFERITLADNDSQTMDSAQSFLKGKTVDFV